MAPQGSLWVRMWFPRVLPGVKSQRQLGVRPKLPFPPGFTAVTSEVLVCSLTPTEDCG